MNFTDRISNQTTIYYSQGRYNRQQTNRLSSPILRSPKNQQHGKESTKEWVARSFHSEPKRVEASAANVNDHAKTSAGNSGKDYTDTNKISYHGKPAIFFQQSIIDSQAEKFKFCLVGRFPRWRPSLSQIRAWAATKWKLSGNSSISLLDHRHVFIRLDNEADMLHVWTRSRWFIGGHMVRVFKWFPTFVPSNGEPSSAAIWVSFPSLPLAFFQEEFLFPIAALAGKVLAMDDSTRNLTRTNVARVCIEVDLLKELPRQVWIGVGEGGFWQDLYYWRLPTYCSNCREQGHSTQICHVSPNASITEEKLDQLLEVTCQANVSDSQSRAPKSKKKLNFPINKGKCSKVYSGESKRVRISPIIEHDEGSREPMRLGSSQSSMKKEKHKEIVAGKGESISDDSSKDFTSGDTEKNMYTEAIARRGECLYEKQNSQNEMTNQGIDVTGKSKFSETAAEAREKGVDRHSEEEGESFGQVLRKSPPRRQIISSKMLNFLSRRKQKDHTPETQLRFAGNVRRERRESEFGSTLPLRSHVPSSLSHLKKFQYSEIVKMTGSFRLVLGNGGFGTVFKGILPDGQEVAVKGHTLPQPQRDQKVAVMVHTRALPQGENVFYKEIEILKNTRHANIIRLLDSCSEGRNRFLVYEFMPKGSLAEFIHSEESSSFCSKHSKEQWEIAIGTARGVEYLHHGCYPPILHLDIKPHNILLDEELRPKLADFGISSIYIDSSHCETIIRGTPGYLDPVFYRLGQVSRSTDVYSYGITLLEMVLGRRPINTHEESQDDIHILHWVRRRVTPMGGIRGMALDETQRKMLIVGIWCTQDDPALRPSVGSIIHMLEGSLHCLSLPCSSVEEKVDNGNEFGCDDYSISDASFTGG